MTAADPRTDTASPSLMRTVSEGLGVFLVFGLALVGATAAMLPSSIPHATPGTGLPFWLWGCGALLPLLIKHERLDAWSGRHRLAGAWVAFAVCAMAALAGLYPNLNAEFGVYDDHEIVRFIGVGQKHCHWSQLPGLLMGTEVGTFGVSGRYRPGYFTLRIAESCLWGGNAALWYASRIALCTATLTFLWWTVERWWGACLAFAFVFLIAGLTATGDTARLGPSESYAMAALALGIWAWCKAGQQDATRGASWLWWTGALGFAVAELSKENFVPIAGLAVMMGSFVLWHRGQIRRHASAWASIVALTLVTAIMLLMIVRMLKTTGGHDVYNSEVSSASIGQSLGYSIVRLLLNGPLLAVLPLLGWGLWEIRKQKALPVMRAEGLTRKAAIIAAIAGAAWLSQAAFYRGINWPAGSRYDFPGVLIPIAGMIAVIGWLLRSPQIEMPWRKSGWLLILFVLPLAAADGVVHDVRAQAQINATRTRHFSSWMRSVAKAAKSDPQAPVILVPDKVLEHYEPLVSLCRYLRYRGVANPVFYTTKWIAMNDKPSPLMRTLVTQMKSGSKSWSQSGLEYFREETSWPPNALFVPFGDYSRSKLVEMNARVTPKTFDETTK